MPRSAQRPAVTFVFLDGVGLGPGGPENPFAMLDLPHVERLVGGQRWTDAAAPFTRPGHVFRPIDATLGVEGLPQSGTGQASLFTGINCAERAGRHFGPFPHSTSKPVIARENLFVRLREIGRTGAFVNAYPERFFRFAEERNRWTVTTLCCVEAGVPLRREADVRAGEALTADLTGAAWPLHLGLDIPVITEADAGRRLARHPTARGATAGAATGRAAPGLRSSADAACRAAREWRGPDRAGARTAGRSRRTGSGSSSAAGGTASGRRAAGLGRRHGYARRPARLPQMPGLPFARRRQESHRAQPFRRRRQAGRPGSGFQLFSCDEGFRRHLDTGKSQRLP